MSNLGKKLNQLIRPTGFEVKRIKSGLNLAALLQVFFQQHQVDCIFDVGANVGGYGKFLRNEVGYKGLIISFEPVAAVFESLRQNAANDRKWITNHLALGAENTTLKINVTAASVFNSFLTPEHGAVSGYEGQNEITAQEEVAVRRLDSLFAGLKKEHGFRRAFLKMDTQGFDQNVMRGADSVLKELVGLQSEMSLLPLYKEMPGLAEMYSLISQNGFDMVGMYPVNRDAIGRWVEADCVFLRRE